MTICNKSIEAARGPALVGPDDTTFEYIRGRRHAPQGEAWDAGRRAVAHAWPTDEGALFDKSIVIDDADTLEPMVTYGTNPGMGIPVTGRVPRPEDHADSAARARAQRGARVHGPRGGQPIAGQPVEVVFIGFLHQQPDQRPAPGRGRAPWPRAADGVRLMIVPGSQQVKQQAEREGLHEIYPRGRAEWRESGCSMCIAMNGDSLRPASTRSAPHNRNFEGRQGKGGRRSSRRP